MSDRECGAGVTPSECDLGRECKNCPFWRMPAPPAPPRQSQLCGARLVVNSVPEILHLAIRASSHEQAEDVIKAYCIARFGSAKVISHLRIIWATGDILVVGRER